MIGTFFSDLLFSASATAGFGLLFHAPRRSLLPGALIGGLSYSVFHCIELLSGQSAAGALAAGLLAGFLGEYTAEKMKMPSTVFTTMGIIASLPGFVLYNTMLLLIQGDYRQAASVGASTMLTFGAIALALGCSTVVFRKLRHFKSASRRPGDLM